MDLDKNVYVVSIRPARLWLAVLIASLGCVLTASLGCGSGGKRPVPVSGAVTLAGQPVTTGTLTFQPIGGDKSALPVGTIDAQGHYEMMTGGKPGAPLGKYKVIVFSTVPSDPSDEYSVPKSLIPTKYNSPDTSDLLLEVVPSAAAGAYDLKLTP